MEVKEHTPDTNFESKCLHTNEIADYHEGNIVCVDCGVVRDCIYESNSQMLENIVQPNDIPSPGEQQNREVIKDMLDRLNLPEKHVDFIVHDLKTNFKKKRPQAEKIASSIFSCVNLSDGCLSLSTLSTVSGVPAKRVKHPKNNEAQLIPEIALEKYCNFLDLNYKSYTVIKEEVQNYENTGFNPLTIIASLIYKHCKTLGRKISMRKVADIVGINTISIQRFLKNAYSSRT